MSTTKFYELQFKSPYNVFKGATKRTHAKHYISLLLSTLKPQKNWMSIGLNMHLTEPKYTQDLNFSEPI